MLAYRHAFHAGNHADVLKHVTLVAVLRYMNRKERAYRLVDTHAGAGLYSLEAGTALKTAEFREGVARLWDRADLPDLVRDYLALVRDFNPGGALRFYPGSPALSRKVLRSHDESRLFEMHPADREILGSHFDGAPGVEIFKADGFAGLARQLPPAGRRGAALIDPSYEGRGDYALVVKATREALAKLPDAALMIWYPQLNNKPEPEELPERLASLSPGKGWLHARLTVAEPGPDGFGMVGSGMVVLNPPYTLRAELESVMPWLTSALAQFPGASHLLEYRD